MNLDDIKLYLPKYLSAESEKELFDNLKDFPEIIDNRIYSSKLIDNEIIYQGDGLKDLLIINLPETKIEKKNSMIISNTCDIDIQNSRYFPSQIIYTPIINLKKYSDTLFSKSTKLHHQINDHITAIKRQKVTQIFYLPENDNIQESFVFLDRINNIRNDFISRENITEQRLFTLSNFGLYLFLFKLSVHFTRIQENIDR